MEGVSVSMYNGLRSYWKRKGYKKLSRSSGRRKRDTIQLGSVGRRRRRRVWRIKISPKFRFLRRIPSLKKILIWLRDSYVKAMLALADSRVVGFAGDGIGGDFSRRSGTLKEYDEKMIVEIYKSLVVAQGKLVAGDSERTAKIGGCLPPVKE